MKTTEASIQATLKQALETCGYIVGVVNAGRNAKASVFFQTAGLPDLFVTHEAWPQGEWLGLELKTATGRLRPAQKALHEKGRTVVVRSVYEGLQTVGWAESGLCLGGDIKAGVRREKVFSIAAQIKDKETL